MKFLSTPHRTVPTCHPTTAAHPRSAVRAPFFFFFSLLNPRIFLSWLYLSSTKCPSPTLPAPNIITFVNEYCLHVHFVGVPRFIFSIEIFSPRGTSPHFTPGSYRNGKRDTGENAAPCAPRPLASTASTGVPRGVLLVGTRRFSERAAVVGRRRRCAQGVARRIILAYRSNRHAPHCWKIVTCGGLHRVYDIIKLPGICYNFTAIQ